MIFLTHLLGGILALAYFRQFFGISSVGNSGKIVVIATAMLFSVLPDIDTVKSKAGKALQPFSTVVSFVFRHRGFLHSFIFAAIVYFGIRYILSPAIAAAAVIGYSSHLFLDSLTKEGIMPFWPLSKMKLQGFIKTGGLAEKLVFAAMIALLLLRLI